MRAVNEWIALTLVALAIIALASLAGGWAQTTPSTPAEAPCLMKEDSYLWVPLRCGNHEGETTTWWVNM